MIAILAHDHKKNVMFDFVEKNLDFFKGRKLIATGRTAKLLGNLGLEAESAPHGPHGGDLLIGGMVAQGKIEAVLFFRDPLTAQPHEPDVNALMRVCDVHDVPLATNIGTAVAILESNCIRSNTCLK